MSARMNHLLANQFDSECAPISAGSPRGNVGERLRLSAMADDESATAWKRLNE